jgi:hypothetical protein
MLASIGHPWMPISRQRSFEMANVSTADLHMAADWCRCYEPANEEDEHVKVALERVAQYLIREADRRETVASLRTIRRDHHLTAGDARKVLARIRKES